MVDTEVKRRLVFSTYGWDVDPSPENAGPRECGDGEEPMAGALPSKAAGQRSREGLAILSHEVHGPLNVIIGFAELMFEGKVGPVSADHKEYLGDILDSARHLAQVVDEVLAFAGLGLEEAGVGPEAEPVAGAMTNGPLP